MNLERIATLFCPQINYFQLKDIFKLNSRKQNKNEGLFRLPIYLKIGLSKYT